jgi:pimeloyl-ACP methyl ester carboxylesterase
MADERTKTSFAEIAVRDAGGAGPPVLLIHGNSASKAIFARQFESSLAQTLRLIAIDLPGHGQSSDAFEPAKGYTIGGYARAAVEVLEALGVARAAVFGWSLGGHVALDMIARVPGIAGVMISGTPPIPAGPEGFGLGFRPTPLMQLTGAPAWTIDEAEAFARAGARPFARFMLDDAMRTHGIARATMVADALSGGVADQRRIAETAPTPLAIVNGAADAFVNADYFATVAYANLWDEQVHNLAGLGHAPFWEAPATFNPLLERFARETAPG